LSVSGNRCNRALGATLVASAASIIAMAAPATLPDNGRAELSAFLRESVARGDAPGVAAIVVDRDRVLFLDAAGKRDVANHQPMAPDAIFRIASMTKPVTSLAAMMLIEQGQLRLDDPVTTYLPDFAKRQVLTTFNADGTFQTRPPRRPVTVRDLLTNTAGVGYGFSDARVAKFDERKIPDGEQPLLHDPGDKWTYGTNTAVVGRIIESITGQKLDAFYRDRIFAPLHMDDTFYAVPVDRHDRVVTQHQREAGSTKETPNGRVLQSPARGDGGLFSTARDYGTFMQLFLNGGRQGNTQLLGAESVRQMLSNQIGDVTISLQPTAAPLLARPFPIGAGKDKFGFGFQLETAPVVPGMRSAGSGSWGGIFNTHFWIDPQKGIAAAVLMQVLPFYDDACLNVLRGFEGRLYQHLK
jgi:methyl acetate hydrolase